MFEVYNYRKDTAKYCSNKCRLIAPTNLLYKGCISWCKGKKNLKITGNKHPLYKHGMRFTRFYRIWAGIIDRTKTQRGKYYIGIKVCKRWQKFENFRDDMYSSYLEHVKEFGEKDTTIDRFPNQKGHYSINNTRWATRIEQSRNRGVVKLFTAHGKSMTLPEWGKKLNKRPKLLWQRIYIAKWPLKYCLSSKNYLNNSPVKK